MAKPIINTMGMKRSYGRIRGVVCTPIVFMIGFEAWFAPPLYSWLVSRRSLHPHCIHDWFRGVVCTKHLEWGVLCCKTHLNLQPWAPMWQKGRALFVTYCGQARGVLFVTYVLGSIVTKQGGAVCNIWFGLHCDQMVWTPLWTSKGAGVCNIWFGLQCEPSNEVLFVTYVLGSIVAKQGDRCL